MTERCRRHALTYCEECHSDIQDDIAALLRALGISDHARPASPHAVVHEEIIPAIASLTARAVRAEADAKRLDWLQSHHACVGHYKETGKWWSRAGRSFDSLREAIDAASRPATP